MKRYTTNTRLEWAVIERMMEEGWTLWVPGSTPEEQQEAVLAYGLGKHNNWYPPGYIAPPPPDTSGKLMVSPESEEEPSRKRLFGFLKRKGAS